LEEVDIGQDRQSEKMVDVNRQMKSHVSVQTVDWDLFPHVQRRLCYVLASNQRRLEIKNVQNRSWLKQNLDGQIWTAFPSPPTNVGWNPGSALQAAAQKQTIRVQIENVTLLTTAAPSCQL
jgi:hypothetical protein